MNIATEKYEFRGRGPSPPGRESAPRQTKTAQAVSGPALSLSSDFRL
ncbi:Uncharacterized protein ChrSV_0641 [Chromobacterium vaccinii]|nr:Uncharacterized protein ChrSW_0641 [Chromobacterium vaccinii]QND88100.1 Uncharacterized protein ChrSV_0641 [Chromobacterium vaccinii]